MSGWFGSGGLGFLGSARQQFDPEDDPMEHLYGMLGTGAAAGALGVSTQFNGPYRQQYDPDTDPMSRLGAPQKPGRRLWPQIPLGSVGGTLGSTIQPPLRRMNGTPRTMYGGTPADVGGMDEADYVTRLRQPRRSPFPSGGYGYGDPLHIGAAGLGTPGAYSSNFSRGGVPGVNDVQGPHVSPGMYTMQGMADQMRQNNRMNPKAPKPRNPQMDELMAGIGGYEASHAARQRMMDNNMAAIGAMGRPNGGFVRGPDGQRSLPLVAPNGNIDAELARAQQIRSDGRLAQGGLDDFTHRWRGINQNMPMPMTGDGPSPQLIQKRQALGSAMQDQNRARQLAKGIPDANGLPAKNQLGMSIGGYQKGAMQDRYAAEKVRRQEAIGRGQEFRQNRMAAMANAMQAPDASQHAMWAMSNMLDPNHPHAAQWNPMIAQMAMGMYHGKMQAYQNAMQNRYLQNKQNQDAALGGAAVAAQGGVNPFVPAPKKPFNYGDMADTLGVAGNMSDKDAMAHLQQQGVNAGHLQAFIAEHSKPKLGETQTQRILREHLVRQAQRMSGMIPQQNLPPMPQQPSGGPSVTAGHLPWLDAALHAIGVI